MFIFKCLQENVVNSGEISPSWIKIRSKSDWLIMIRKEYSDQLEVSRSTHLLYSKETLNLWILKIRFIYCFRTQTWTPCRRMTQKRFLGHCSDVAEHSSWVQNKIYFLRLERRVWRKMVAKVWFSSVWNKLCVTQTWDLINFPCIIWTLVIRKSNSIQSCQILQ